MSWETPQSQVNLDSWLPYMAQKHLVPCWISMTNDLSWQCAFIDVILFCLTQATQLSSVCDLCMCICWGWMGVEKWEMVRNWEAKRNIKSLQYTYYTRICKLLCSHHHCIRALWSLQILHQIFNMQYLHYRPSLPSICQCLHVKLQDSFGWVKWEWMGSSSLPMFFQLRKVPGSELVYLFPPYSSSSLREDEWLLWLSRSQHLGHTLFILYLKLSYFI